MSLRTYDRLWREAEGELARVVTDDKAYVAEDVIEDRQRAYKQAATNYIRYSLCVNKLGMCLDQMVHVQKRLTVRTLLEATMARLLQVKQELVNMDMSDFNYLDGVLVEMKLTPFDVELQVPRYYRRERADRVLQVNQDIDRILHELANPPPPEESVEGQETDDQGGVEESVKKEQKEEPPLKEATSTIKKKHSINPNWPPRFKKVELTESQKIFKAMILLVQRHERARVARLRTQELKEKKRTQHDIAWLVHKPIPEDTLEWSVRLIQRFWRGYYVRHRQRYHHTQARLLMGELIPSWRPHEEEDRARAVEEEYHERQRVADEEYAADMQVLEAAVHRRDEDMKDDIADHLRWYIEHWYRTVGELPDFPEPTKIEPLDLLGFPKDTPVDFLKRNLVVIVPSAKLLYPGLPPYLIGGSALVVAGFWVDPLLYDLAHIAARLAKGKGAAKAGEKMEKLTQQQIKEKKEEEKEKKRLENEAKKKELEEKLRRGVVPNHTELLDPLYRQLDKSKGQWKGYDDLEWNPGQRHREDLPHGSMVHDRNEELREVVDDLMRLELERLQAALDRDRGKKKKGGDKKKKKKPKAKKGKKDPTGDRTTESLFKELVENGIIKKTPDARIDSLFCEPSWNKYDLRRDPWWQDPSPNLWDVKQVVKEYCVLPLGSATVHRAAPLVRSALLAGYPDCGQRLLVDAVAAETGSVLFDLSPANTAGKYPGRKGLKMLVHLVTKMSRLMQPSVVLIEGGEKPFYKKVPKTERQDNPKLLKKQLPKMVKAVTPEDQVLFLATAENPWMGKAKAIAKTYNKIIPVLPPDQATSSSYWRWRLMKYHGVDRDFLYSPLAWCTQGFTLATVDKVLDSVLTAERVMALHYRPLDPQELLAGLLQESAVPEDQRRKLRDWYQGTYPMAKRKAIKAQAEAELRDKLAAIEAKKKEQQKKKK